MSRPTAKGASTWPYEERIVVCRLGTTRGEIGFPTIDNTDIDIREAVSDFWSALALLPGRTRAGLVPDDSELTGRAASLAVVSPSDLRRWRG